MNPTDFPQANKTLSKPDGWTAEQCGALRILCTGGYCISRWKMSWPERIKALFTGVIWLSLISGKTQPPAAVSIDKPFLLPHWFCKACNAPFEPKTFLNPKPTEFVALCPKCHSFTTWSPPKRWQFWKR